jgi:hypothetical protein
MDAARPDAISRAYELLSKVAAYKTDAIASEELTAPPRTDEDESPVPSRSPSTHSPASTADERRSTSSTAAPTTRRAATPTLEIIPAGEPLVSTAAQTSTPLWGGGAARGVPPPPPPPPPLAARVPPPIHQTEALPTQTATPTGPSQSAPSLNQSTVAAASGNTTLDTSADDPRRVVIHSLTPPRVTTVVRQQRRAMTPPQGFFSNEIAALEEATAIASLHPSGQHQRSTTMTTTTTTTSTTIKGDVEEREIEARYARAVKSLSDRFAHFSSDDDLLGHSDPNRSISDSRSSHQQFDGLSAAERLSRRTAADIVHLRRDASEVASQVRRASDDYDALMPKHSPAAARRIGLDMANVDLDWLLRSHRRASPAQQHSKALKGQRASTPPSHRQRATPVATVSLRAAPEPSANPPTPTPRHSGARPATPPASVRYHTPRQAREGASSPRVQQDTFSSANRRRVPPGMAATPSTTPPLRPIRPVAHNVVHHHPSERPSAASLAAKKDRPATHATTPRSSELTARRSTPQQRVSEYTKKLLKEHQERIASKRSQIPKQKEGDASSASLNVSASAHTNPKDTGTTRRATTKGTSDLNDWEPMPNRHAIGASIKVPRRVTANDTSSVGPAVQPPKGHEPPTAIDIPVDVSYISAASHHHHSVQSATPQRSAPLPRSSASVPLMEYLFTVVGGGPASFTSSELSSMSVVGRDNGRSVTFPVCRAWAALTMMINQPVCVEEIVVPLLIAELQNRMDEFAALGGRAAGGRKDPSVDIAHLLCAFIGLGSAAKAALDVLLEMLENGVGDANLVGLAVRVCGGEAAVRKLCTMASDAGAEYGPQTQLAAVNALALLPRAQPGHTSILCVGIPQLQGSKMFYQPRSATQDEGSNDATQEDHVATRPVLTPHQIGYRTTFVIFDAELVRRYLASLTTTALYQKRWREQPVVSYGVILQDFFSAAPYVCNRMQCDPNVNHQLAAVESDAAPWLEGEERAQPPVLVNSLHSLWQKEPLLGRHITMTLIRLLHSRTAMPALIEAALRTIAVLPPLASEVLAEPLVDYTTNLVDLLHAAPVVPAPQVQLVKEAILSTSRVVNPEVHPQKLVDSATAIAVHLLRNDDASLIRAGCIALGTMGPISSNPHAVIKLIVETLMEGRLPPKTCCWALARSGRHGAACLVDIASQVHLGPSQRIEAARALGYLTITSGPKGEGSELVTGAVGGLMRLVVDHMTRPSGDALAVAALHSLVELHQRAHKRGEHRLEYATTSTLCNMLQDILRHHTIGSARFTLLQELFLSLCRLGGPRGLLIVGDIIHGAGEHAASLPGHAMVDAAFGLRGAGTDGASILASALSHERADVRAQAADTLIALGNAAALAASVKRAGTAEVAQRHLSNALHLHPSGKVAALIEGWLHRLEQDEHLPADGVY